MQHTNLIIFFLIYLFLKFEFIVGIKYFLESKKNYSIYLFR